MCDVLPYKTVFKRIFEYIRIFEYFPPNIDIRIRFVVIWNAEYYSNIRIFCLNIFEYWSLKIRGNAGIKEVLFSFLTGKVNNKFSPEGMC